MVIIKKSKSNIRPEDKPTEAVVSSRTCSDLTEIYKDRVCLCIWENQEVDKLEHYSGFLASIGFQLKKVLSLDSISEGLEVLPLAPGYKEMKKWVVDLVEVFTDLFDSRYVGLRIAGHNTPMCPKFHVDHVPIRLIQALSGPGCDWFDDPKYFSVSESKELELKQWIDRAQCSSNNMISQAPSGSVVIMKGTKWKRDTTPVIHRSPKHEIPRLVLTLDHVDLEE